MTRHEHQAQRESLPETPTRHDRDLASYPQGDREATYVSIGHDQPAQDASQTPSDPPTGTRPPEEYQMPIPESGQRTDTPSEGKEELANSDQGSATVSLQGRSLPSSKFSKVPGEAFQILLGDLLKDTPEDGGASTQSGRARAWDSFVSKEDHLRSLRMRADKYRQKAILKRREMRSRLTSFAEELARTREQMPELLAPQLSHKSKELDECLLELDGIEEELDGPEIEIVVAEWNLSHLTPRLLSSQNADETFRILVENEYHFPADDEDGSDSVRSSLGFPEEPSRDAYVISSKLENVAAIEEKILQLQNQSLDAVLISEDLEPSSIPLPAEQLSELQRLKDDLQEATSDLERSRDLLQSAPEDDEAVQSDSLGAVLRHENSPLSTSPPDQQAEKYAMSASLHVEASPPLSTRPPDQQAESYARSGSLRVEASPPLYPAHFAQHDDTASGRSL